MHNNDNVVCDLRKNKDQIWNEYKSKVRRNVRKAIKSDVHLKLDFEGEHIDSFLKIYYETMERRHASEKYFFKKEFFDQIHDNLKGNFVYFYAIKDNEIISADLVLMSDNKIYTFLSATDSNAFQYRPNDFVKHNVIKWGVSNNKDYYVLGGGYKMLDSLYSYKKSFAPEGILPFYVGKKIYNANLYNQLVESKEKELLENLDVLDRDSDFFPLYRMNR
ncbi:MAG: lipid II:glycine glycyltransferase (peptidoglycan interpeptide bridge formation enzyme) [Ancylomarina sp.]